MDQSLTTGIAVVIGAGLGVAIFAATGRPAWIGVGAAVGVVIGAVLSRRGSR